MKYIVRRVFVLVVIGVTFAFGCSVLRNRMPPVLPRPSSDVGDLSRALAAHVEELAGRIGPRHARRPAALRAAATYIEQRLLEHDYDVELQQFSAAGETVANVEARARAADMPMFVVGAHYDTVPGTPGANDNASGVAVLLEVARMLRNDPLVSRLRFVAFTNEEPPFFQTPLMGSLVYATRAKQRGDAVAGMLSLETIGYYSDDAKSQQYPAPFQLWFPNTGHFIAAVSNWGSYGLLRGFAKAFKRASPLPLISTPAPASIPGVGWSDHWAFWEAGYRAILLTDTAPYRYPHYHAATDTPDKLDYVRLAYAASGVAKAVSALVRN